MGYLDNTGLSYFWQKIKAYVANAVKVTGVKGEKEVSYRTGNVNITASNIGAYASNNYERGTIDVGVRPLVNFTRANRLVFLRPSQVIIEQTTDGGATWTATAYGDSYKLGLFSENGASVNIPLLNGKKSTQCGLRITITGMNYNVPDGTAETDKYSYWNTANVVSQERYFNVREWWFWLSANTDTIRPEIYRATGAKPDTWIPVFTSDFGMTGWSGSDWVKAGSGQTFGGGTNQTGKNWNWRLIFWSRPTDANVQSGTFLSDTAQSINQIRCYGDSVWNSGYGANLGSKDHLYTWDNNRNATFPGAVTASTFYGALSGNASSATNAAKVNNHTVNADVPSEAVFTDTQSDWNVTDTASKAFINNKPSIPTASSVSPTDISSSAAAVGSSSKYAREDHTHKIEASAGDSNGSIKIAGKNVGVRGLAGAAYRGTSDSINKSAVESYKTNLVSYMAVADYVSSAASVMIIGHTHTNTSATSATKTIILDNLSNKQIDPTAENPISAGTMLFLTTTYTNTADNPKFSLFVSYEAGGTTGNPTTAMPVKYGGAVIETTNKVYAGCANRPALYIFDGSAWNWLAWSFDNYMELS